MYTLYTYPSKWMMDGGGDGGSDTPAPPDQNDRTGSNGHGGNGQSGNGGGHPNAVTTIRPHAVSSLMPYFLEGVKRELDGDPTASPQGAVQRLEQLLVKRLPIWKRVIDICGALFGIIVASIPMTIAALAIKFTSRGPVVFKQKRAGLGGVPFTIYKFRTMCIDAEAKKDELRKFSEQDGPAFKMKKDPRVTAIGKLLRKTSIDELPQLFNVLKGDMTLVGPRPLPLSEADKCDQWQRRRLDVTPGLTCIWQVKGRSSVTFAEWVRMDVAYIRRRSVVQDISILLQTIPAVLLRKGAS
jgi:lipopolysaccharide/colanic/teichoic acid biosynthesis glycosyltransferase